MGKKQIKNQATQIVKIKLPQTTPQKLPKAKKTSSRVKIIIAIIGALGAIIAALILAPKTCDGNVKINLNFQGWYSWGGIQAAPNGNTVTLNGKIDVGGYMSEQLPQDLRGKTVTLKITNAAASNLTHDWLIKITVNKGDRLVRPRNVTNLIEGEYIPSNHKLENFTLPDDFDGKLGFVFYQADLKDLKITAYYQ
jgi:hypothetical protein